MFGPREVVSTVESLSPASKTPKTAPVKMDAPVVEEHFSSLCSSSFSSSCSSSSNPSFQHSIRPSHQSEAVSNSRIQDLFSATRNYITACAQAMIGRHPAQRAGLVQPIQPIRSAALAVIAENPKIQVQNFDDNQHQQSDSRLDMSRQTADSTTEIVTQVERPIEHDFAAPHAPNGVAASLMPPSAPPAMRMTGQHLNDLTTGSQILRETFDSPYVRSASSTAPGSPKLPPLRQNSGSQTPRVRPHATSLNIPGMTRSKVSPDGQIAKRDVAAKLVIIMVGLPARGKSYITKKIQRYLSWQQHNTKIFNVGNRRRVAAGQPSVIISEADRGSALGQDAAAIRIRLNDLAVGDSDEPTSLDLNRCASNDDSQYDQSAKFFDPKNSSASELRERVALETLDELLDYLLEGNGAVGILDATNSTIHRRELLVQKIRQREPKLGILFLESICKDEDLLEANMRLKLSGPDYKDKDPTKSYEDFKKRVKAYESAYVPIGEHEESLDLQYIQMIDVGRKIIHFDLKGFLSSEISAYLTTFNLSPRQIWLTRHGQSVDNVHSRLGGNSHLTMRGECYGEALYHFITQKRREWLIDQEDRLAQAHFPPKEGDDTPPYPDFNKELDEKNFCVWTSMLHRSIETAKLFDNDDDYDVKSWEMLNELNAGSFEGMTYNEIMLKYPIEAQKREADKLSYVYPGVGGEGYLQVISRLRGMVREIERVKDHVLIIGHRSICRVLLAYFMDLTREDIANMDMPLGMLYCLEPRPYGIEFHAFKYDEPGGTFTEIPSYRPQRSTDRNN